MNYNLDDNKEILKKVLSLKNERLRKWNDIVFSINTLKSMCYIINLIEQYKSVVRVMIIDQLNKGYHTSDDRKIGEMCLTEIKECNKMLYKISCKVVQDKIIDKTIETILKQ